jgi:hypothetical protein
LSIEIRTITTAAAVTTAITTTTAPAAVTTTAAATTIWSRYGLVVTVTCYRLDGPCFDSRREDFSLRENVQVGYEAHEASYSMGTRNFSRS